MIKLDDKGLVPAIVQDADTGRVLTLAYMNQESLERDSGLRAGVVLQPEPAGAMAQG